jgi:hypothetical protein
MVDFIDFLQYGLDESYAIYAQIYQIHRSEAKTLSAICSVHQEAGRDQEEDVGNEHWWVW